MARSKLSMIGAHPPEDNGLVPITKIHYLQNQLCASELATGSHLTVSRIYVNAALRRFWNSLSAFISTAAFFLVDGGGTAGLTFGDGFRLGDPLPPGVLLRPRGDAVSAAPCSSSCFTSSGVFMPLASSEMRSAAISILDFIRFARPGLWYEMPLRLRSDRSSSRKYTESRFFSSGSGGIFSSIAAYEMVSPLGLEAARTRGEPPSLRDFGDLGGLELVGFGIPALSVRARVEQAGGLLARPDSVELFGRIPSAGLGRWHYLLGLRASCSGA